MSLRWSRIVAAVALALPAGCTHMCHKCQVGQPVPVRPGPGGNIILPTPVPSAPAPAPAFPATPSPSYASPALPPETPPPPVFPGTAAPTPAAPSGTIRSPELLLPEDRTPAAPAPTPPPASAERRAEKPAAPAVTEGSFSLLPLDSQSSTSAKPRSAELEERPAVPPLPADIAGFAVVKGETATGRRPGVEGHDWLKASGYKAVLHLKRPGEDDATDRRAAESRGLRYLSLEVSAASLSPELAAAFDRAVVASENQPLFVYDRDGELAGALWFVHLRRVDGLSEDAARTRATRLGLRAGELEKAAARLTG